MSVQQPLIATPELASGKRNDNKLRWAAELTGPFSSILKQHNSPNRGIQLSKNKQINEK